MNELILDGHKLAWHTDRLEAWLRGERIAPITIDCALTRRCTYDCTYCYSKLQVNDEMKITRDVIYRFLDDAAEIGVKAISFVSDGESTCSPYFYEALLRGKNNGLDMALGTNGFLLYDEHLKDILSSLTYIRFNISAADVNKYMQIHGCSSFAYLKVINTIKECVKIKMVYNLPVTIGIQMVLLPEFRDQIIPLAKLGKYLEVDYFVIKHCSDDELKTLKVDYSKYTDLISILKEAESYSTNNYVVRVKWSKILSEGKRSYYKCYGPVFMMQFSGSGLIAPCGMLFNKRYKNYHIGNIADKSFKEIWKSDRYWEVLDLISSDKFDARTMCGSLCLQHNVNKFLWDIHENPYIANVSMLKEISKDSKPMHVNFI